MKPLSSQEKPTMLVILDGFGYTKAQVGNAIFHAKMPFWHMLFEKFPHVLLEASGLAVGLPDDVIGNSEVGHLTIGAGRIIKSSLTKINERVDNGSFFTDPILVSHFQYIKNAGNALHLMGLLSDGGVHSLQHHLHALIKLAKQIGITTVYVHAF